MWSIYSTSGYLSKVYENANPKRYMHPCVHSALYYKNQEVKMTWLPIDGWVDKEDVVNTHDRTLLSH